MDTIKLLIGISYDFIFQIFNTILNTKINTKIKLEN